MTAALALERGILTGAANAATYKLIFHMGSPTGMPAIKFGVYAGGMAALGSLFYGMVGSSNLAGMLPQMAYGPFTTESLLVGLGTAYMATKHMSNEQFLVSLLVTAGFYNSAGNGAGLLSGMSPSAAPPAKTSMANY